MHVYKTKKKYNNKGYSFRLVPLPRQRLVDYSGGPPSKGWLGKMEEHWYGSLEVSGSSTGSVKFSLPFFSKMKKNTFGNEHFMMHRI
jgi:hypothetical protein